MGDNWGLILPGGMQQILGGVPPIFLGGGSSLTVVGQDSLAPHACALWRRLSAPSCSVCVPSLCGGKQKGGVSVSVPQVPLTLTKPSRGFWGTLWDLGGS